MSDKPETHATVLAELRARAEEERECGWHGEADDLLALADRIEAAAERERVKARHDAAALREALVEILDRTNREKARDYDAALNGGILEIHDIANTALDQTKGE